jgi:hypothetical protein
MDGQRMSEEGQRGGEVEEAQVGGQHVRLLHREAFVQHRLAKRAHVGQRTHAARHAATAAGARPRAVGERRAGAREQLGRSGDG